MWIECMHLFLTFLKLGFLSFGGGYAMLSMIMTESKAFGITPAQFADMNALDMIVPGAIAINAATYVGYLYQGIPGAIAATVGVSLPSFILTVVMMRFFTRFKDAKWLDDILAGIKPAAVGLIVAAVVMIAEDVLMEEGYTFMDILSNPLGSVSWICVGMFVISAVLHIRFHVNPILLTVIAGIVGGFIFS